MQWLDIPEQKKGTSNNDGIYLGRDRLHLSLRELEAFHFNELIRSTPDIRVDRVTQVRGDIEGGNYNVVAVRIAEKIIRGELLGVVF